MPASHARRCAAASHRCTASDLLPIAFTEASLDIMVANVQRVQERLAPADRWWRTCRPTCAGPMTRSTRREFFNELARRSGCSMLLDVNNLVVNAHQRAAKNR